jgi:hypothetical protein
VCTGTSKGFRASIFVAWCNWLFWFFRIPLISSSPWRPQLVSSDAYLKCNSASKRSASRDERELVDFQRPSAKSAAGKCARAFKISTHVDFFLRDRADPTPGIPIPPPGLSPFER